MFPTLQVVCTARHKEAAQFLQVTEHKAMERIVSKQFYKSNLGK